MNHADKGGLMRGSVAPDSSNGKEHQSSTSKKRNFTMISNELMDEQLKDLTRVEGFAFLVLARKAVDGIATVEHSFIAEKIGCHRNSVQIALDRLVELGFIRKRRTKGLANDYELLLKVEEVGGDATSTLHRVAQSTLHKYLDRTTTKTKTKTTPPLPPPSQARWGATALAVARSRSTRSSVPR
jgi:DNA-binding MarR family transcriptional regulator